jgi:hypothetical protein
MKLIYIKSFAKPMCGPKIRCIMGRNHEKGNEARTMNVVIFGKANFKNENYERK